MIIFPLFGRSIDNTYSEADLVTITLSDLESVKVLNLVKYAVPLGNQNIPEYFDLIDFSNCKNIWLYDVDVYQSNLDEITNPYLETLILDDIIYGNYDNTTLKIDAPNLKNLLFSIDFGFYSENIRDIDLSSCTKLQNLAIGNDTAIESLDFLSNLNLLESFSLGDHSANHIFDMDKSFREKIQSIETPFDTSKIYMGYTNNNFINDLSPLKGKENLKVLNICSFYQISSEQLFDLIKTLPSLKKIVGLKINNAVMASYTLIHYCTEHDIEQPFNYRSMALKEFIRNTVAETTTPEMDDFEKIKALSYWVIDYLEYFDEVANKEFYEWTSKNIENAYGKTLSYIKENGIALCFGYTVFSSSLFTEAKITNYASNTFGHIYNLVEIDGIFYQIDLTQLDDYLENEYEGTIDDFEWNIGAASLYLVPVSDKNAHFSFAEPYKASLQRKQKDTSVNTSSRSLRNYVAFLSTETVNQKNKSQKTQNRTLLLLSFLGIAQLISPNKYFQVLASAETQNNPFWSMSDYYILMAELTDEKNNSFSQKRTSEQLSL